MSKGSDKIDALIAELEESGADPARLTALRCTQQFKRSWLELAEALVDMRTSAAYEAWGYDDFHTYCATELHLRRATVDKLTVSFSTLQRLAPQVLKWDGIQREVPSYQAVDYFGKAMDRAKEARAANDRPTPEREQIKELRTAVFDEGQSVGELRRRFDPVFRPKPKGAEDLEIIGKAKGAANKLIAALPDVPGLTDRCTTAVEKALGALRTELEELEAPIREKVDASRKKTSASKRAVAKNAGAREKKKAPPRTG
ncbi:MAG: hypothetical protein JKY37_13420 [Nannocystaceae bacterium]|nr:hypothetical protein [Nannocystaceae bacterium]